MDNAVRWLKMPCSSAQIPGLGKSFGLSFQVRSSQVAQRKKCVLNCAKRNGTVKTGISHGSVKISISDIPYLREGALFCSFVHQKHWLEYCKTDIMYW
jgi:hypothetical protein